MLNTGSPVPGILQARTLEWVAISFSKLDSTLKSRGVTLLTKVHLVKATVFPEVMYECKSWTIKKAECRRTNDFEVWYWRRLLRVPWATRRSNQSILKEISPEYSCFTIFNMGWRRLIWKWKPQGLFVSYQPRKLTYLLKPSSCLISHNSFSVGNGNPLQYSCLENPRDGGAWWAAIYGVVQSRTRLK